MNPDEAEHSESTEKCSMLQRVFGQLKAASLSENTIVCASDSQVELIESYVILCLSFVKQGCKAG